MPTQYDDSTKKFMDDIVGDSAATSNSGAVVKTLMSATRATLSDRPAVGLAKLLTRKGIGAFARKSFEDAPHEKLSEQASSRKEVINLYKQLNNKYGDEWFDWEPETILRTIDLDFGIELDDSGKDAIGALQMILNTNQAHEHWHIFEKVGHAFNDNVVDFSVLQPLRPDEIALTLKILNLVRPAEELEPEVSAYVAASAKSNGIVYLPEEFFGKEPQMFLDSMNNDLDLKKKVELLWGKKSSYPEDAALDIQLKGLQEIKDYVEELQWE